jgi:hypothetical protein
MLRIHPSKLGVILSAYSASLGRTQEEVRDYDSVFWGPNVHSKPPGAGLLNRRCSHALYYDHLVNPELLSAIACFAHPKKTTESIQYIRQGILGKPNAKIVDLLNGSTRFNSKRNFWSLSEAHNELAKIKERTFLGRTSECTGYKRRLHSIKGLLSKLRKLKEYLPPGVISPDSVRYTDLYLSKFYGHPNPYLHNNIILIAGSDGTLIYSYDYKDDSMISDKWDPLKESRAPREATGYIVITPKAEIYIILRESRVPFGYLLEADLQLPKVVASVMLWAILYAILEKDGSVFDFVPGLMQKQIASITSESFIIGVRAHPADLEHEEDGSITDLVSSIASEVNLVEYPCEAMGLRAK